MLYFGYMFVASMGFLLVTGTVGYMSSWWFVLQIYGAAARPKSLCCGAGLAPWLFWAAPVRFGGRPR